MSDRVGQKAGGDSEGGFLGRWSKRKIDDRAGKPLAEPVVPAATVAQSQSDSAKADQSTGVTNVAGGTPASGQSAQEPVKLPTLQDVQHLTPESDFKPFMAQGVTAEVKNAAMKKLFADPHFNVMDRLDTYIDDYSLPDPLPESMLRKMASAKFLGLFDDDEEEKEATLTPVAETASPEAQALIARDVPDTPIDEVVAQSQPALEAPEPHDHIDLRLQPDHAAGSEGVGRGAA